MFKTLLFRLLSKFVPNLGTILVVGIVMMTYRVWAAPVKAEQSSPLGLSNTISYQGTLTDAAGAPIHANVDITFRLYNVETVGAALWEETHMGVNAVPVQNGLFHVLLGSLVPIPADVWGQTQLYLGIQIATDLEMTPREVVGLLPAAFIAQTVPDASITTAKLNINGNVEFNGNSIGSLGGIDPPFSINSERPWSFTSYGTGSETKTALHSVVDGKSFLFTNNNDSTILGIRAENTGGNLDMFGHPILNVGAIIDANLQTPEQLASAAIESFRPGEVLCWDGTAQQLIRCNQTASPLVVAVAGELGKPVIVGVSGVNVLGPVQPGDLLVSSDQAGCAVAWSTVSKNELPQGVVIAKALAACAAQARCQIKALILVR